MAAEDRPQVGGDGQPAAVVAAVEADDVPVVGEPGRHGRAAAPVPPVEELAVERRIWASCGWAAVTLFELLLAYWDRSDGSAQTTSTVRRSPSANWVR